VDESVLRLIWGITELYHSLVKTAISIPDDTFEQVTRSARQLGLSRSEFFTRAAIAYLKELESKSVTARINAALDLIGDDDSYQDAVSAGRALLRRSADEW
jgi:metal-responsive CopG/Arc/MetJ family transcriptional regulator